MTDQVPTWVDGSAGGTPINAANLNLSSVAIRNLQTRVVVLNYNDPVPTGLADGTLIVRKRAPFTTETWTGANGAAWPGVWTTTPNGGTVDIQSNAGRILTAAAGYSTATAKQTGLATGDLLVQLTLSSTAEQYHFIYFRDDLAGNYYRAVVTPTDVGIQKSVSGSTSYITSSGPVTLASGTPYWVRVDWVGSALKVRLWTVGSAEPASWTNTATDTTYTAAGSLGLGVSSGSAATAITSTWDNLTVQDLTP